MRIIALHVVLLGAGVGSLTAQVDPSGSWRTWHTNHFRVHAKASHAAVAVEAAREAERAYGLLALELQEPRGTIDLVVADNVDFSNGFATVLPSNRVTIYVAPPGASISTGRYDSWLRLVITHELVHIFHLDRAEGIWGVLQTVFGRVPGLFPNTYQPSWVTEGLATYYESRFTTAGRVRGSYHDQLLLAAEREDRWPTPGEATFANRVWPAGNRPYAWGSRFFQSQSLAHGDSVVPQFVDHSSRQLIPFNISAPMKAAGGEGVGTGWARIRPALRPERMMGDVVERGLRSEPRPRVSAGGRYVAYRRSDGRHVERLVVRALPSGAEVVARRVNAVDDFAWQGDTLYATQLEFASPVEIRSDLYRLDPGGRLTRVTAGERVTGVCVLPGGQLGLLRLEAGRRSVKVVGFPDTASTTFQVPEARDWGRLEVSPDGRWVVAARHAQGRWDIVLWPVDKPHDVRNLTDDPALDADPTWSSDGERVVFASERAGLPQVFSHHIATGRTEQLTAEPTGAREPSVTPGDTLYYSTVLADGYAVMRLSRPSPRPRADVPSESVEFAAAPDVSIRETGYAPWGALRPFGWLPFWHDENSAGQFFGLYTFNSDPIERTGYVGMVTVAPETGRWEGGVSLFHTRWRSWTLDVTGAQTWDFGGFVQTAPPDTFTAVSFRERSGEVGLSYRWRRWRHGLGVRGGVFLERDELVNDEAATLPFTPRNPTFAGGVMTFGASRLERPPLSISLENGVSLAGLYLRRWELGGTGWSYEARGSANAYVALPLPGFASWVLAARIVGGRTGGPTPTVYAIGGESGDVVDVLAGTTLGSGRRTFPLRGYARGGRFTRAVVGIAELRIPILLAGRSIWKLPLLIDHVSANVFGEVGGGWNDGESAELTSLRDVGAELRIDVGVGAGLLLPTRVGWAVALKTALGSNLGDSRFYVAFGPSF
jgi:hypothetical protein